VEVYKDMVVFYNMLLVLYNTSVEFLYCFLTMYVSLLLIQDSVLLHVSCENIVK